MSRNGGLSRPLTYLYRRERMGPAHYTKRDLNGAQGKPVGNILDHRP